MIHLGYNCTENVQVGRLIRKRGMNVNRHWNASTCNPRRKPKLQLRASLLQTPLPDDLWKQVSEAWKELVPFKSKALEDTGVNKVPVTPSGEFTVKRGKPKHSSTIAELITRLSKGKRTVTATDVMEDFGDKAYMLLEQDGRFVGLAGWQVENLVARTSDIFLEENLNVQKALATLIKEVESASSELQSEASLIFAINELSSQDALWKQLGYERRTPEALDVQAWQDAAAESISTGCSLFFKPLRKDRVLRPI